MPDNVTVTMSITQWIAIGTILVLLGGILYKVESLPPPWLVDMARDALDLAHENERRILRECK